METEYINHNDEPRMLTKFERESLNDWYFNEGDFDNKPSIEEFESWLESISWSEIDEIMGHYITVTED